MRDNTGNFIRSSTYDPMFLRARNIYGKMGACSKVGFWSDDEKNQEKSGRSWRMNQMREEGVKLVGNLHWRINRNFGNLPFSLGSSYG